MLAGALTHRFPRFLQACLGLTLSLHGQPAQLSWQWALWGGGLRLGALPSSTGSEHRAYEADCWSHLQKLQIRNTVLDLLVILFHCLLLLFYGHMKRNTRVGTDMFQETFTSQESDPLEHELADVVSNGTGGEHSRLCWPVQRRVAGVGGTLWIPVWGKTFESQAG